MLQAGTGTVQEFNDVSSRDNVGEGTETSKRSSDAAIAEDCDIIDDNLEPGIALQSAIRRDAAIILLKKEIESALKSLDKLKAQMDKMQAEKEEILASERCSRKSIGSLINQTVVLRDAIDNFGGVVENKICAMDGKISRMEESAQEILDSWFQQTEVGCLLFYVLTVYMHGDDHVRFVVFLLFEVI